MFSGGVVSLISPFWWAQTGRVSENCSRTQAKLRKSQRSYLQGPVDSFQLLANLFELPPLLYPDGIVG